MVVYKIFFLHFVSLITVLIVKSSHILAAFDFDFLRNGPRPTLRKIEASMRKLLVLFCNFASLILG